MQIGGISSTTQNLATASTRSSGAYYDPRDTNKDGIVSSEEQYLYDLVHPEAAGQSANQGLNGGQGKVGAAVNLLA